MNPTHALFTTANVFVTEVMAAGQNPALIQLLPADYWQVPYKWTGRTPSIDLPAYAEILCAQVDLRREEAEMAFLTKGGAKKYIYACKAVEYANYKTTPLVSLTALLAPDKALRWPFVQAEVTFTGDSFDVVMARIGAAMNSFAVSVATIDAKAVTAKRRIRAATTKALMDAAYKAFVI